MDQAENGFKPMKDKKTYNVKVAPSDVSKNLSGIENLLKLVGDGGSTNNPNTSNHLHLHLQDKTHKEIIDERNAHKDWFDGVLEGTS